MLIQYDIPANLPPVLADGELIIRVAQNLIGNALKFSGRGSTVLLRAFPNPPDHPHAAIFDSRDAVALPGVGSITVAVVDCGVGIAAQDQEKIFAKFGQ